MSNIFESLKYKIPLEKVTDDVNFEILEAKLKNPNGWRSNYFYNFHLNFPYCKNGIQYEAANLANARELGVEHIPHLEIFGDTSKRHTEMFLAITPVQMDQIRVMLATDLGFYDDNYLGVVSDFIQAKDAEEKNYEDIRLKREAMFYRLEPFWIRYKALAFSDNDLKS